MFLKAALMAGVITTVMATAAVAQGVTLESPVAREATGMPTPLARPNAQGQAIGNGNKGRDASARDASVQHTKFQPLPGQQ